jgi:hypothetical protein
MMNVVSMHWWVHLGALRSYPRLKRRAWMNEKRGGKRHMRQGENGSKSGRRSCTQADGARHRRVPLLCNTAMHSASRDASAHSPPLTRYLHNSSRIPVLSPLSPPLPLPLVFLRSNSLDAEADIPFVHLVFEQAEVDEGKREREENERCHGDGPAVSCTRRLTYTKVTK